jgi:hypothetical protein
MTNLMAKIKVRNRVEAALYLAKSNLVGWLALEIVPELELIAIII